VTRWAPNENIFIDWVYPILKIEYKIK